MRATDHAATIVISAGGLSVIAAVLGICLYLLYVTVPLLAPGRAGVSGRVVLPDAPEVFAVAIDEYQRTSIWVNADGSVDHRSVATGELIGSDPGPFGDAPGVRVTGFDPVSGIVSVAADGAVAWGRVEFLFTISDEASPTPDRELLEDGRSRVTAIRYEQLGSAPTPVPAQMTDVLEERLRTVVAAISTEGVVRLWSVRKSRSLIGTEAASQATAIEVVGADRFDEAFGLRLLSNGDCLVVSWDGTFTRLRVGRSSAEVVETGWLWDDEIEVTALTSLIGRRTLVAATSEGRVGTWWVGLDPDDPADRGRLVSGPALQSIGSSVTALAASLRDRTVLVGDADGGVWFLHASSGKQIARAEAGAPIQAVAVGPKLDGFLALTSEGQVSGSLEVGHPDVTTRSLFGSMLYEGQLEPMYKYQASGATDATEPKLSLVPLIFGTIKATVVSMLFAAPIAVLAAIYTSEFMSGRFRRVIKPLIETMASLPSVVLGFVAAMVIAPFVADHLGVVLTAFVVVPAVIMVASGVSGLVAHSRSEAGGSTMLPAYVIAVGVLGVLLSVWVADPLERALFGPTRAEVLTLAGSVEPEPVTGEPRAVEPSDQATADRVELMSDEFGAPSVSIKNWLGGVYGGPGAGWFVLLAPACALLFSVVGWPMLAQRLMPAADWRWGPLARVLVSCVVGLALGAALAVMLERWGVDARESILGTFTQRNTFVIGIVMGFAIIPIIFTISDDALQSVPSSLRAASLGAGATRWQTTIRVVLPVAASGIFSATMIGLGRAVGETMIVLMATGNTPIMDWNIFEGLRTLSANIAVELPEAERGGTHYRLLFLCGVVLFAMTFVVNTTAEIVRQRFRKRNALL